MSQNPVTRLYGPKTTRASDTLFDRMGGEKKLDEIVTGVYNDMRADREIGKQFARFRLERLKDRTVDYLRGEFGGDAYKGSDLWISHSHMGINNHWYDIMMKYYVNRLKKARIGKKESEEILESLEKMRKPIVDPGLKLKEMYLKHNEREAAKAGGDGWGYVSNDPKERAKKEKETLDMLAKNAQAENSAKPRQLHKAKSGEDLSPKGSPKSFRSTASPTKPTKESVRIPSVPAKTKERGEQVNGSETPGGSESTVAPASEADPESPTRRPKSKKAQKPQPAAEQPAATPAEGPAEPPAEQAAEPPAPPPQPPTTLFNFTVENDSPPAPVPSSRPSGAELLYRLSTPCR